MALFKFKVRDENGALKSGEIEATSMDNAADKLVDEGFIVIALDEIRENVLDLDLGERFLKIKGKELVFFYLQISTLLNSGVNLVESLSALEEQVENPKLCKIVGVIKKDVLSGVALSDSMRKFPDVFSNLVVNLVEAGEAGGMLDEVFEKIATFSENDEKVISKVKSAMTYPIIMIVVAFSVVTFLLTFVFPKFVSIFRKMGGALPLPTAILLKISNFLTGNIVLLTITVIGGFISFKYFTKKTRTGIYMWDLLMLNFPLVGQLTIKANIARMCKTLGVLTENGVPILNSMKISTRLMENVILTDIMGRASEKVAEGEAFSEVLKREKYFPPMVIKMISVGEKTGNLSKMLVKIGDFYDLEVEMTIETMLSLLEPLLIVSMGIIMGFIAVAMFMPMFDMIKLIKK
ncbi:MAG: type II secretion system F family protein [Candidatus Muiribacteriaceae bacterium]